LRRRLGSPNPERGPIVPGNGGAAVAPAPPREASGDGVTRAIGPTPNAGRPTAGGTERALDPPVEPP
jgi:hypothetical protein